jgi:anti-sigma factor (TIGR02949 family)
MTDHIQCEEVIERLLEFLDRELDSEVEHAIEHHLEACRACFSRAEFERRLRARIAETGEAAAPETLRRRLRRMMARY